MKNNFYENDYVEYWIEDGIVMECFKSNVVKIDIRVAKTIVQDRLNYVTRGIKFPLFIDTNKGLYIDKESREYLAGNESLSDMKASALLIHNPIAFISAKLFLIINSPRVKCEFFSDKEKALNWLRKYKV